ncbi:L-threonylcarbamoyladenylate synthase [Deinococcus lacus]|uniref:L-threonylcarbamoyladenylate synthase n=1 Tax=Deinococcus lacus TaxID=392561 RepID=A0ABW1YB07_9DEIO
MQASCRDAATALALAAPDPRLDSLAALWPGPLTLVVRAGQNCPAALAPGGWVGLRVPDHPVAAFLLEAAGGPLATSSLNRTSQPPVQTYGAAIASGLADLVLPPGPLRPSGVASTVIRLEESGYILLREGAYSGAVIRHLLALLETAE